MSFVTKNMYFTIAILPHENRRLSGWLHSPVLEENVEFHDLTEMLLIMDKIIQDFNIPRSDDRFRTFPSQYTTIRTELKYHELNAAHFEEYLKNSTEYPRSSLSIFQIKVMYRQNNTWQGEIDWINENKTKFFRSALELMILIYYACDRND